MVSSVIFFIFPMVWQLSDSLQCYKCVQEKSVLDSNLCQHFDESGKYVTDCPHSTMCYKKLVHLNIANGLSTTSIQRGCAAQTQTDEQEKVNGKWHYVNNVHEVYEETCSEDERDGLATSTTHCYCRGHLCNNCSHMKESFIIVLLLVILIFMLKFWYNNWYY